MKSQMKKLISMILAMAMVVTSINFTPKNVSAEDDGSGWTTISNMRYQSSNTPMTLNYKVAKGAESSAIEAYGDFFLHVYPEGLTGADNATIYLNEGQTTTGETVFAGMKDHDNTRYNIGLGLRDANLKANTYYSLRFVYGTHDVVYYFYTGNKEDIKEETTPETTTPETTTPEPEPSITLQALTKAYVYNYSEIDGGYKVSFTDPNTVTVENEATYTYTLNINGQTIENIASSGSSVDLSSLNLTEGTAYTVTMNAVYKKGDTTVTSPASSETTFTYRGKTTAYDNGIPQIFINSSRDTKTKDINLYTDTTKTKVNASLMIKGADGSTTEVSNSGTVNVRGNSTSRADKKAYNLKFNSSINPFGMGSAKKWSLLANIFDKTLIRNHMGLDFQRYLESTQTPFANNVSKAFTSNCKNVDLYVDGKYLGTYLLTESVEVGADRVNIDTSYYDKTTDDVKADSTPTTVTINGTEYKLYDALLELANDSRLDTDAYYFKTSVLGQQFGLNDPVCSTDIVGNKLNPSLKENSTDAVKPQFVNDIRSYLEGFENVINSTSYETSDAQFKDMEKFIDVDSFVDFYITSEYFMTKDIGFSSTRFYIKDGKLYAGPLWDLDLSSGNIDDHKNAEDFRSKNSFKWFEVLMKNKNFYNKVVARYKELLPKIKSLYADNGEVDTVVNEISKSVKTNYEKAYNYKRATTDDNRNVGWGYSWLYGINGSLDGTGGKTFTEAELKSVGSYGSGGMHDTYEEYITEYKTWLKNRNKWLMSQFNIGDEDAAYYRISGDDDLNSNGVGKDTVDGLNNYVRYAGARAIAYSPIAGDIPSNAIDTQPDTKWEPLDNTSDNFKLKLGNTYNVKELLIKWQTASAADYEIEVSTDGKIYNKVAEFSGLTGARTDKIILRDSVEAKYIRIVPTKRSTGYPVAIFDFSVYGSDSEKTAEEFVDEVEDATQEKINPDSIANDDWEIVNENKSSSGATIYMTKAKKVIMAERETMCGYYGANTVQAWGNISDNMKAQSIFGFVAKDGGTPTGIIIDGVRYMDIINASVNKLVYVKNDCVFIKDSLLDAKKGEISYHTITVEGNNLGTFLVKVVGSTSKPITPIGLKVAPDGKGIINVVWGQNDEMINNGQKYNVYIDDELVASGVACGSYNYEVTNGTHTVKLTATLNGYESDAVTATVGSTGGKDPGETDSSTVAPTETATETPTETTTAGEIDVPGDANWITLDRSDGEYKYYIPSEYSGAFVGKTRYANPTDVYIEFSLGAPFSSVKLDNNDYTKSNGAFVNVLKSDINDYQVHKLDVVATNGKAIIYLKRVKQTVVTFVDNQWEKYRNESITWNKVDGAIKYAIYVDGKLYITTDDENTTSISVPAYAFAKATNNNGQATTVGKHTTAVVAIKGGDEIKETLSDVDSTRVMGSNSFQLYVNYIFGRETNLWNHTGVDSKWNFTICEGVNSDISTGADVKVDYTNDGQANLTFNNMGKHTGSDQAWTIKAAIYNEAATKGELQNLSFKIYGPKELIGETIKIKCCPEEYVNGAYSNDIYEEKEYTFERAKDGSAVLNYSISFNSTNDSYDLLFGLGLLDFKNATNKTLTFSDADINTVYGITDLKATGTNVASDDAKGDLFVSWSSNVPDKMAGSYKYQVEIDGVLYKYSGTEDLFPGTVNNITASGYSVGEHKVVVKSIYDGTVTSSKETTAIISNTKKPDLVVTGMSIPKVTHYIGENLQLSVTIKNIGNAVAKPVAGKNLIVRLYEDSNNGKELDNKICYANTTEAEQGTSPGYLKPGEEYTVVFDVKINENQDGSNIYKYRAFVDADRIIDEGDDEDNNEYSKSYKFYDPLKEVTFGTENGKITATWPASDDVKKYIVEYTVGDETKTMTVTDNKCSLGDLEQFTEGTTVTVTTVGKDDDEHVHAKGTPKSDLIISSVSTPSNAYGVGDVIPITVTMKNVGLGVAKPNGNNNMTVKPTKDGKIIESNIVNPTYRTMGDDNLEQKLNVGAEFTPTVTFNYTVQESDLKEGTIHIGGYADGEYVVDESDENNNCTEVAIKIISKGAVTLDSNNGDGPVKATWKQSTDENVDSYQIQYVVDGNIIKKTISKDEVDSDGNYVYTFGDNEGLDNESEVKISVKFAGDDNYYNYASTTAMVDLIVSTVKGPNENNEKVKVDVNFNLSVIVKNIGTAKVSATADTQENYGKKLYVTLCRQEGVEQVVSDGYYLGLNVGKTASIRLKNVCAKETGTKKLIINVDDAGWDTEEGKDVGYIQESNENNNSYKYTVNAVIEQNSMDWTTLKETVGSNTPYQFKVAQGTKNARIEYKVVSTNNQTLDYKDIIVKYTGYNTRYMSIGFNPNYTVMTEVKNDSTGQVISTVPYWAAITKNQVDSNIHDLDNCTIMDVEGWDIDGIGVDGNAVQKPKKPGTHFNRDGNGFNMNVDDFDLNAYYLLKLYNKNGDYVVVAFRVTDENGDIGDWTQIQGNNMDNSAIPVYYHTAHREVKSSIYYDKHDIKLSNIAAYNGNHISVDLDTQNKINPNANRVLITRGLLDSSGDMIIPSVDGTYVEEGTETGSYYACTGDLLNTNSVDYYKSESNYVSLSGYGINGNNKIQIMLPNMLAQIPVHSALGGKKDNEYYYMKVYWDEQNYPGQYVSIPIKIKADIPEIEKVNGLVATNRGSSLSISWVNSTQQEADGYLYDVYIDGELKAQDVQAGSYSFLGYNEIGSTHTIKVVAKWCEQTTEDSVEYTIVEPEKEPEEIVPGEVPTYPDDNDNRWILISGQHILPVSEEGSLGKTNAKIYYYTDEDINGVTGYNDSYISLNGSSKYFTGTTTKIFVQRGDSTSLVSKSIYDSYYEGQTLMNSSTMFELPKGFAKGTTYYYVVRVCGNNGNTYKDFYFKIIPTDDSIDSGVNHTGKWREISGESQLSVKMGSGSKLKGTISFLDYPAFNEGSSITEKGGTTSIGTNTYNAVGYNGYYLSIIGDTNYYVAGNTKVYVSEGSDSVLYAENANDLTFTEKKVSDQSYSGQIISETEELFSVVYATTYYLLKVQSGDKVTYIPFEVKVNIGNVEVLGFQMNTNKNAGGVAEYNPSFRVVSKTSNVMTINNRLYEVKKMGTVYAIDDGNTDIKSNMNLDAVSSNANVSKYETTDRGKLAGYTTSAKDNDCYTYYALTFKYTNYKYASLEQKWAFRAYAVLDMGDGTEKVVYGKNIYTTNMYDIAQNLYKNQKMGTKESHDYLYDNVLNIVDMYNNMGQIANAMFKAMGVTSTSDSRYETVTKMTQDLHNYCKCLWGISYDTRGKFRSSQVEDELLKLLNGVKNNDKNYDSVYDWIYNETSKYGKKNGTKYKGCYRLVDYSWDNSIDKDFYKQ
ncbi:MAG: CotH kinase family protein [Eubacterium sp.]